MAHAIFVIGSGTVCGTALGTLLFSVLYDAHYPLYVCMPADWLLGMLVSAGVVLLMLR